MSSNKTSVILNFESEKAPKIEHFDHKYDNMKLNEYVEYISSLNKEETNNRFIEVFNKYFEKI